MSLILDAINRAEKDRTDEPLPHGLQPNQSPEEQKKVLPWVLMGFCLACMLLLLAAAFFWYSINKKSEVLQYPVKEPISVASPKKIPQSEMPIPKANDERLSAPVVASKVPEVIELKPVQSKRKEVPSAVISLYEKQVSEPDASTVSAPKAAAPAVVEKSEVEQDLLIKEAERLANEALVEELLAKKSREDREEQLLKATQVMQMNKPKTVTKPSQLQDQGVPLLWDLSTQVQSTIPSLEYSEHQFIADNHPNNFIVINGRRAKVGDEVANGVNIQFIRRSHSVFRGQGRDFKLNALNSWVNFD